MFNPLRYQLRSCAKTSSAVCSLVLCASTALTSVGCRKQVPRNVHPSVKAKVEGKPLLASKCVRDIVLTATDSRCYLMDTGEWYCSEMHPYWGGELPSTSRIHEYKGLFGVPAGMGRPFGKYGNSLCALNLDGQPACWGEIATSVEAPPEKWDPQHILPQFNGTNWRDGPAARRKLAPYTIQSLGRGLTQATMVQAIPWGGTGICGLRDGSLFCSPRRHHRAQFALRGFPSGLKFLSSDVFGFCAANDREVYCDGDWISEGGPLPPEEFPPGTNLRINSILPKDAWPRRIELPPLTVKQLGVGAITSCVLSTEGKVYCWGVNDSGGWGNGEFTPACSSEEMRVAKSGDACDIDVIERNVSTGHEVTAVGSDVIEIAVGAGWTCALKRSGEVWCWGDNSYRIVTTARQVEYKVRNGEDLVDYLEPHPLRNEPAGTDNIRIMANSSSACVIKRNGTVWCWGHRDQGKDKPSWYPITQDPLPPCP